MGALEQSFVASQPRIGWMFRLRGRLFGTIPLMAWTGSVGGILCLAGSQPSQLDYRGLALVTTYEVAAPVQARLDQLLVREQCSVEDGQVIGHLDAQDLELRAQRVRHSIAGLRAEVDRERELHQENAGRTQAAHGGDQRRFVRDVEDAQLSILELVASIEEDRIRLKGLEVDLTRETGLASQEVLSDAQLIRTRTDHDALRERIQRSETLLEGQTARLRSVEARQAEFQKRYQPTVADVGKVLSPFQWRIKVQGDELEMLALARTRLTLRAPAAGRIAKVFVRPGELVTNGQPVVSIVEDRSRGAMAFVPLAEATAIQVGMPAHIQLSTRPGTIIQTQVSRIGAAVEELPAQLLIVPTQREWGVPIYFKATSELKTVPGESLRVRIVGG